MCEHVRQNCDAARPRRGRPGRRGRSPTRDGRWCRLPRRRRRGDENPEEAVEHPKIIAGAIKDNRQYYDFFRPLIYKGDIPNKPSSKSSRNEPTT